MRSFYHAVMVCRIVASYRLQRTALTTLLIAYLLALPVIGCKQSQGLGNVPNSAPGGQQIAGRTREDLRVEWYCGSEVKAGQVLVKPHKSGEFVESKFQSLLNLITNDNVATEKLGNSDVLLVRSTTGRTVDALLQSFKETKKKYSAFIDYAEPDYIIRLDSLATDPTDNPDLAKQWGLKRISALSAWQVPTDGNVVVAVIDSGIDYDHEDLKDNVWCSPPNFTVQMGGKPIKCPTGSHGFDVTVPETESDDKKCDPASDIGHGTHVAGIIGAADNNHGGVGVAPKIKILAVKYADNHGAGCVSDVVRALDFIVEASKSINIRVINCSFGFYIEDLYACSSNSQTLQAALQRVDGRNIIIVASNGDVPCDTSKIAHYPSGYYLPNLIAVTATDEKDNKDLYCCGYDSTSPQLIGAPGMYIWSTLPTNTYGYLIGTSMATSFVSGAAALILSDTRDGCDKLIATKLRSDLLIEADHAEKGNLANYIMEGRRLNVDRAIKTCSNYLK